MNTKSWGRNFGASQTLNRHLNTERGGVGRDLDPNNVDVDEACSRGGNAGGKKAAAAIGSPISETPFSLQVPGPTATTRIWLSGSRPEFVWIVGTVLVVGEESKILIKE